MSVSVLTDTTLLAQLTGLTREDTGEVITSGVTVTAKVYRAGVEIATVTLTHSAAGTWRGIINAIDNLVRGERLDIKWTVEGGASLRGTWWERRVVVQEQMPA